MNKVLIPQGFKSPLDLFPKIPMRMRITSILLAGFLTQASAETIYSQSIRTSLEMNNVTVEEVLNEIEANSEYTFLYNSKIINVDRRVSVSADPGNIDQILKELFGGTDVVYKINDKHIVLSKRESADTMTASVQQKKTVTGTVVDASGIPVIGANVMVKGTTNGTITDMDGRFTLEVPDGAVLEVSYIGYLSQNVKATGSNISVVLKEDTQRLDEVVVVAYGSVKRKDFTGSMSKVDIENTPLSMISNLNPLEALKGNVPGLDIGATNNAGKTPGSLIRGENSISGSNEPLIVVDGVIFMGGLNDINPNDIESFNILKDATSSAAYGSRSANGVILVTTKKGRTGKPVITFNANASVQLWQNRPRLMNGQEYLDAVSERTGLQEYSWLSEQEKNNMYNGKEVDWYDEATRVGYIQDYQVSISGASEKVNYYLSTSYTDNSSVVVGDDYNRISLLSKINTDITSWLQLGTDFAYTNSDYSGVGANLTNAQRLSPYGVMYRDENEKLLERNPAVIGSTNPLWGVNDGTRENIDKRDSYRLNANILLKCPWIEGLSYKLNYSYNRILEKQGNFYHEYYFVQNGDVTDLSRYSDEAYAKQLSNAKGDETNVVTNSWVLDNILSYSKKIGKHSIDLTAVATRDSRVRKSETITAKDFSSNGNTSLGLRGLSYAGNYIYDIDDKKFTNIGYFARASYSFNNTYYLTGSYRRDGASVFGKKHRWGNFGSFGVSWRISNEKFFKKNKFVDDLKLKFSWGKNGNQGLGPYATLSQIANGSKGGIMYEPDGNSDIYYGIEISSLGNPYLGWETTTSWNTGFEMNCFNNRVFVDMNVYYSRTSDQIFTKTIPAMTGFVNMKSSMGQVDNRGVELSINSLNLSNNDWKWNTGITFWLNRNKLKRLYGEDLNNDGKEDDDIGNKLFIGHSIHSIYGYKQDGLVQEEDVDYMNLNNVVAGTPKYVDLDGDGIITEEDRSVIGCLDPNFKLNISNTISYKNFELYFMFGGVFGGNNYYLKSNKYAYIYNSGYATSNGYYRPESWTPENRSNKYPIISYTGDDRFMGLQSRTFVRLQDLTLSYTFDNMKIKNAGINKFKVFVTAKNPLLITGWNGIDPELGIGAEEGGYPVLSSYSVGFNMSF